MMAPLPEPAIKTSLPDRASFDFVNKRDYYTEAQMLECGRAEFERAVVLAMQATRPFGSVGDGVMNELKQAAKQAPTSRPCNTCNAGYTNDLPRIIRCGTCVVRPGQMPSKWGKK